MLYILIKYVIGPFILLFWRPVILGRENLNIKGKAIFVSNHISMCDPLLIALLSPRIVHFMAKAELFQNPIGNIFFRGLFAFPVKRGKVDLQSLKNALKVLNQGKVFGIFPEGKRAVTDSLDEFEKGTAFLAIRSGAPIIPIYIHPDSYRKYRPKLIVGKPVDMGRIMASASKSKLIEVATDEIADEINALKLELEEALCL